MTNQYIELKTKHEKEVNAFPMFFAFDKGQFNEGLQKLGVKAAELLNIGLGGFIRKSDKEEFKVMFARHREEMSTAIEADNSGEGFIKEMFRYELANHEYGYTYDLEPTFDALGLTSEKVEQSETLKHGLRLARTEVMDAAVNF